jgi:poly(3-hydroxybutyrate) depolymerase
VFTQHLIGSVPWRYRGARRRVYPGFVQLAAFMSMNIARHARAHAELYRHRVKGEMNKARTARAFYDEYFTVTDLPGVLSPDRPEGLSGASAAAWPAGVARPPDRPALYPAHGAVHRRGREGRHLLGGPGGRGAGAVHGPQALYMRRHHVHIGAGHYGVFSGARWQNEVYPQLRSVIHANA